MSPRGVFGASSLHTSFPARLYALLQTIDPVSPRQASRSPPISGQLTPVMFSALTSQSQSPTVPRPSMQASVHNPAQTAHVHMRSPVQNAPAVHPGIANVANAAPVSPRTWTPQSTSVSPSLPAPRVPRMPERSYTFPMPLNVQEARPIPERVYTATPPMSNERTEVRGRPVPRASLSETLPRPPSQMGIAPLVSPPLSSSPPVTPSIPVSVRMPVQRLSSANVLPPSYSSASPKTASPTIATLQPVSVSSNPAGRSPPAGQSSVAGPTTTSSRPMGPSITPPIAGPSSMSTSASAPPGPLPTKKAKKAKKRSAIQDDFILADLAWYEHSKQQSAERSPVLVSTMPSTPTIAEQNPDSVSAEPAAREVSSRASEPARDVVLMKKETETAPIVESLEVAPAAEFATLVVTTELALESIPGPSRSSSAVVKVENTSENAHPVPMPATVMGIRSETPPETPRRMSSISAPVPPLPSPLSSVRRKKGTRAGKGPPGLRILPIKVDAEPPTSGLSARSQSKADGQNASVAEVSASVSPALLLRQTPEVQPTPLQATSREDEPLDVEMRDVSAIIDQPSATAPVESSMILPPQEKEAGAVDVQGPSDLDDFDLSVATQDGDDQEEHEQSMAVDVTDDALITQDVEVQDEPESGDFHDSAVAIGQSIEGDPAEDRLTTPADHGMGVETSDVTAAAGEDEPFVEKMLSESETTPDEQDMSIETDDSPETILATQNTNVEVESRMETSQVSAENVLDDALSGTGASLTDYNMSAAGVVTEDILPSTKHGIAPEVSHRTRSTFRVLQFDVVQDNALHDSEGVMTDSTPLTDGEQPPDTPLKPRKRSHSPGEHISRSPRRRRTMSPSLLDARELTASISDNFARDASAPPDSDLPAKPKVADETTIDASPLNESEAISILAADADRDLVQELRTELDPATICQGHDLQDPNADSIIPASSGSGNEVPSQPDREDQSPPILHAEDKVVRPASPVDEAVGRMVADDERPPQEAERVASMAPGIEENAGRSPSLLTSSLEQGEVTMSAPASDSASTIEEGQITPVHRTQEITAVSSTDKTIIGTEPADIPIQQTATVPEAPPSISTAIPNVVVFGCARGTSDNHVLFEFDVSPEQHALVSKWITRYETRE